MALAIIVILVQVTLVTHSHSEDDNILYVQARNAYENLKFSGPYYYVNNVWENGRADYVFSEDSRYKIVFRGTEWIIVDDESRYMLMLNKNQAKKIKFPPH